LLGKGQGTWTASVQAQKKMANGHLSDDAIDVIVQ